MATGDILLSDAKAWYAPVGEALPNETTVEWDDPWGGNWAVAGPLATALTLSYSEVRTEADQQNVLSSVKDWVTDERHLLRGAFSETTAETIALLTRGTNTPTGAGGSQKPFNQIVGGGEALVPQYTVGFEGWRPDAALTRQPIRLFYYVASFMFDVGMTFSKDQRISWPFMIKTYADPMRARGQQHFEWHIVTGPTA